METALLLLIALLLTYASWQLSRSIDADALRGRLDRLESKLDQILLLARGDD